MSDHNKLQTSGFATKAIHHGYDSRDENGALCPPLHLSSTFTFDSAKQGGDIFAGESEGFFYSRISNPTNDLLERRLASLEGAEAGVAMASGMGAITSTLWTFLSAGDEIIVDKTLYGCTFAFLNHGLSRFGVIVTSIDLTDPQKLADSISAKTKVVYFETPANPNMRLVNIRDISEIARSVGAKTVVDNTYATPVLTRPIEFGADIVVHSATKYLGGHGDLVAGMVVGSAEDMNEVRLVGMKDMTGAAMSPFTAMLVLRGLKTLELRVARHCDSAKQIALMLQQEPEVEQVYYPGLATSEYYELAQRQMSDFGGMIAFELKGGFAAGVQFIDRLHLIQCAVSLGDAESLVQHPASMTHSPYSPEERAASGISEGLLRLSIGLEDLVDIKGDILQALDRR